MKRFFLSKIVSFIVLTLCCNAVVVAQTSTYNYTGGVQIYTVPAGITSLGIDAIGACGGGYYASGGSAGPVTLGGRVQCTLNVTPGQVLYVYVGGRGGDFNGSFAPAGGFNGGQGAANTYSGASGGASDIRTCSCAATGSNRLVVAGGAGGGGDWNSYGGVGGGLTGGSPGPNTMVPGATCTGGSQVDGGTGTAGSPGTSDGNGGAAQAGISASGGGGGYWGGHGGGGTGPAYSGIGGGGGSSYTDPVAVTAVVHTQGYSGANGNGVVIITTLFSNTAPIFTGGSPQPLSVCVSSINNSINSILQTTDPDAGQTETYSVTSAPTNGSITTGSTATSGTAISPTGWSYTPTAGYTGTDAFTIQVSDGFGGTDNVLVNVTVNPTSATVSGTQTVCVGAVTSLTGSPTGGTWSSRNTALATVGSATGDVTGVAAGNPVLVYAPLSGCPVVITATVNPLPTPSITAGGPLSFCTGGSVTLTESGAAGAILWSTSATTSSIVATTTGAYTVSVTDANGCTGTSAATTVTANPLPLPITGNLSACIGYSTTVSDGSGGGTFSSGTPAVATVNPVSGVVAPVTTGNTTITYTLPTGCSVNAQVTVNSVPAIITGTMNMCPGTTAALADATSGGTWSSDDITKATVSSGGLVTGVAAGNTLITYALTSTTGCYVTAPVTVNPTPAAIAGSLGVCLGLNTTLTDATSGGTWASSASGTAPVGATTGIVNGLSAGNATITYSITTTGCIITAPVTVNTLPSAIGGTFSVCTGLNATVTDASGSSTWSSSNLAVATIGSGTGIYSGVSAGNSTITFTSAAGCIATQVITVNQTPAAITGVTPICAGSSFTLSDATSGGTWSSNNTALATVGSATGIVTGVSGGVPNIIYTMPTGCFNTTPVTVNALPGAIVGNTVTYPYSGSIQSFTVPSGVTTVTILAKGAQGGNNGGLGASIQGDVTVTPGQVLNILVGGQGASGGLGGSGNGFGYGSGGGGGSFVTTSSSSALVVAGGGGGASVFNDAGQGGLTTNNGGAGADIYGEAGGTGGSGGSGGGGGGTGGCGGPGHGGGGLTGDGGGPTPSGGKAFVNGGAGGTDDFGADNCVTLASGGFGGGGAGGNGGGGGGGYSGGAGGSNPGGDPRPNAVGGGGGSFNSGINQTNTAATNSGNGSITIQYAITSVCLGSTTTLSCTPTGGTWSSSNTTYATIGSASGVVTGVTAGSLTLTYTLPTGCISTLAFTVNPVPATITGTPTVCAGLSTTLNDAVTGGTWTSSNANATANSTTGSVTGVTAGNSIITYTLPTGCFVSTPVTINPSPAAIGGATAVCVGLSTTLTNSVSGGTWTSSNTAQATVVGSTGSVTGIASGTPTISYTLPAGCFATQPMTVSPTPAAITGTLVVCQNSSVTLNDVTSGGVWSSSNTSVGTVGSVTGIVTGVAAGATNIVYTLPGGCTATASVTVNPVPNISVFASSVTSQCSGGGAVFTASSTSLGTGTFTATYNLSGATTATGSTAVLTMGASTGTFTTSPLVTSGITTVTLTSLTNGFGCISNLSSGNTAATTTYPLPAVYSVLGTGSYCTGGSGLHVYLSNSVTGVSYQLYYNGVATGAPLGGLPGPLDFGAQTLAGTYTIVATNTTTFCVNNMSGSAIISINPLPTVYAITGGGSYCAGGSGVGIGMANSDIGTTYQLFNGATPMGAPVAGTGAAIAFAPQTVAGTYIAVATNTVTACTNNMSGSALVSINPIPAAIAGATTVCVGSSTTFTDASVGGSWTSVNTAVATIGSSTAAAVGVAAGTSTISYTLPTGCAISTTLTVNSLPAAIGGAAPVACVGATAALTDAVSGGTWSSSNTVQGTVSTAGVLTGLSAGNPVISYALPSGCFTTIVATINTTPAAITGTTNVCTTSSVNLSSTTGGGVWSSSNPAFATVGSGTGVVTGVATGIPNITYTVPTGCFVLTPVTVNPTPAPISGVTAVCTGLSTTLSDGTPGGTWSSSNTALGTVGSLSGSVTGIAAGTPFISYTLSTGCNVNVPVTVSTSPTAITGVFTVCPGLTTTLSDGVTGGSWTSSNPSFATVASGTGVVTGVAAGTVTITYTMPGACMVTASVVVNPQPAAIVGANNVCVGSVTALTDASAGGTWSSSNTALGAVGSASGVVTGIAPGGLISINYTLPTGCVATLPFTVNALPAGITGTNSVCTGLTTALADLTSGGTWTSSNTAQATVVGSTGVVTGVTAGTPSILYTLPTGCAASIPVSVNASPVAITGANTVCTTLTTTLADATAGGFWTSGATSLATINSTSGLVTGVAPGVVVMAYTLPVGSCTANLQMTVNPQPAAVVGSTPLCTGIPVTFTDATAGGVWSSSNSAVASVVGSTGVVTGVTPGSATILYTLPAGCSSAMAITVNPSPAAIAGITNVCVGLVDALTDASGGGLWSSSNTALATVGSVTGFVTGIAQGPLTITYTLPAGCFVTTSFSVNPLPAGITGVTTVCVAATTTLSDATAGGTWSSSNAALATVGSAGTVTGIASGGPVITYTLPSGCIATIGASVNPLPGIFTLSGGGTFCAGGTGIDISLSGSTTGINYQLLNSGSPVASPSAGISTFPIDFGFMTSPGIYTIVATNATTGCSIGMTGSASVSVNPVPAVFTVSGGGSYCTGGTGVAIGLSGSATGINYQLFDGSTISGSPVAGTGSTLNFGLETGTGVYTVVATNTTTGCTATMSGIATISTLPLPNIYTVTGGGGYCAGGTGAAIGLSNSDINVAYQLFQGGTGSTIVGGTGSAISFGSYTTATSYTVVATNTVTACTTNMAGSVSVSINPLPVASAIAPTTGSYCAGSTGVTVTLGGSAVGVNYQLYNGSAAVGAALAGTSGVLSFGPQVAGVYTIIATGASSLCSSTMTGTATITINPLPTGYAVSGGGGYCLGGSGVHILLSNSDVGVTYTLLLGGVSTGTTILSTGGPLDFGASTVAGTYTISANNGCTANMIGSAVVSVNTPPTAYVVGGTGSYCAGGAGIHVTLASSDAGVNYQLYLGTSPIGSAVAGSTGAALDFGAQFASATPYTVVATNPATGCTATMTGSATISTNPVPTVYTITGGGSYCAGGAGLHVYLSNSTTGINYQLYNGSATAGAVVAGTTGSPIDFGLHVTSGIRYAVATNPLTGCSDTMSGTAIIVINPLPTASNVTGGGSYCSGTTGVPVGVDASYVGISYQLYIGATPTGAAVAGTGSAFSFGLVTTPGTYTVVATNTITGCTNTMTGAAIVSVNPLPTLYTISGGGTYCTGGSGLHVLLSGSDLGISYQLNLTGSAIGLPVAGTGSAIDFGLETLAGTYTVTASNPATTCTRNMFDRASIQIIAPPAVFTLSGGGAYCTGGSGSDIYLTNSATGVSYQLYVGGSPVGAAMPGTTGSGIDFGLQTTPGTYSAIATNGTTACTATMTGTPTVSINALPTAYLVTGGGNYCVGGSGVHIGLINSATGTTYQLYDGTTAMGTPIFGTTGTAIDFGLETLTGTYTVVATSASSCTNNMSGTAIVRTRSLPVAFDVTGGGSYCFGGTGVYVGLDSSTTGINYQLYNGTTAVGSPVAGTGIILDFGLQVTPGSYTVVASNPSTGCADTMTGGAYVNTNPLPVAYAITGGGSYCAGGTGVNIGLANSAIDVNYQLYHGTSLVGGVVGGTGVALDFGPQTGAGMYTVVGTDATTGCTRTMSGIDTVIVNPLPTVFNVTGGGSYCAGGTGFHVNLSGSVFGNNYQLYKDGTALGAPVAGTGSALDFGLIAVAGNYTVMATNIYTLCTSNMSGSATISIHAGPTAYAVTGGGGYCTGATGVHIGLAASDTGVNYTLYVGSTVAHTPVAGNDSTLDFGLLTAAGAYTVIGTNVASGCSTTMTGSATVVINTLPAVFTMTGGGGYCFGDPGVHITLSGSATGVTYQSYRNDTAISLPIAGTGLAIDFGLEAFAGTYTGIATNTTTGCTSNMLGESIVSINPFPVMDTVAGGGNYCVGGLGLHITLNASSTGINYQLFRGTTSVGLPITGSGSALDFGLQTTAGTYTVVAVNTLTSCTRTMFNSIAISVDSLPLVYDVTGGGSYCSGGTGVHVTTSGSQTGVNYQLYNGTSVEGLPISGTGTSLDFGLEVTAGSYSVVATNASTTCTDHMTGSATIAINTLPVAYTVTGGGSYCIGGTGRHIGLSGSATGVSYMLYDTTTAMSAAVIGTGSAIDFGAQTASGRYGVLATNTATGCTNIMNDSADIITQQLPVVHHVTGGGSYCAGTSGVHIGLDLANTGINYQLYRGTSTVSSAVAGAGAALDFGLEVTAGTYTVVAINATTTCASNMADSAVVIVTPTVIPTVSISTGVGDTVCNGTTVTFTSSVTNGGSLPVYQWMVNDTAVSAAHSLTFIPTDHDVVSLSVASSATCATPDTVTATTTLTVLPNLLPVISISATPGDTICQGTTVNLTATTVNGGNAPVYSWVLNSTPVGASSTYSFTPADNDVIFCSLTSNYRCRSANTVLSSSIHFRVETNTLPTVSISMNAGFATGSVVHNDTLRATVLNGGFHTAYQWSLNGYAILGANSATYITDSLNNNDVLSCYVVNASSCGNFSASASYVVKSADVSVTQMNSANDNVLVVPNPNKGDFSVKGSLGAAVNGEVTMELTDMLGQSVYKNKVIVHNGDIDEHVQLGLKIANGMYLLTLHSGADQKTFHVVIEQ